MKLANKEQSLKIMQDAENDTTGTTDAAGNFMHQGKEKQDTLVSLWAPVVVVF